MDRQIAPGGFVLTGKSEVMQTAEAEGIRKDVFGTRLA